MRKPFIPSAFGPRGRDLRQMNNRKHKINDEITASEVRVVDAEGKMLGVMSKRAALEIANDRQMDLVEIAPQAAPPVCRIIDYGKFAYEIQKKEKEQRKAQHHQLLKEVRFKAGTDTHDFNFKTRHAREFLEEGNKVKATVLFRGREIVHQEFGIRILENFIKDLADVSKVDQPIRSEGRTLTLTLSPDKKKKGSKESKADDETPSAE